MENRKLLGIIIFLAVLTRLLPHPPNVTPLGGLALFSGSHLKGKAAFILPLIIMFISDLFLGFHSTMLYVYFSFFLTVLIGRKLQKQKTFLRLLAMIFSSASLFFLVTNFGVWMSTDMYAKDFWGLMNAYTMGIPFFRNTLIGDIFYTLILFFGYDYIGRFMTVTKGRWSETSTSGQ